MKKLNKLVLSLGMAGSLLAGSIPAAAATTSKVQAVNVQNQITGTLTGWGDSHSFEAKTTKGVMVFRTYNNWYLTHLKAGQRYTYYYSTDRYGQNIIIKINK